MIQKNKHIYFDNNATTPIDPRIQAVLIDMLSQTPLNPSSSHFFGQRAHKYLLEAKKTIATFLDVYPDEIIFTSGGTESMNLLIYGSAALLPRGHIITSAIEHPCVLNPMKQLEKQGWEISYLAPDLSGMITLSSIERALKETTRLIVLSAANGETGVELDLNNVAQLAQQAHIPLIVDGIALLGKRRFKVPSGVAGMGFSGHKIHAPLGIGFVFIRNKDAISPQLLGGHQEHHLRAGTENLPGIVALSHAISILDQEIDVASKHMLNLRNDFENGLQKALPGILINGAAPRLPNTSNIAFEGVDGESLLIALDQDGIAASHASACSTGALEPSYVLMNMGFSKKRASASIRFSFSRMNSQEEIAQAIPIIQKWACALRQLHL